MNWAIKQAINRGLTRISQASGRNALAGYMLREELVQIQTVEWSSRRANRRRKDVDSFAHEKHIIPTTYIRAPVR